MKNKFEMFNDIEIDINEYEEIKFSNNDDLKNKMKSKIRGNNVQNRRKIAVVGAGVLLGTMVIVSEPSLAYIKNIGKQIEYFFNRQDNTLGGYKVQVNQVVEDRGVAIELKEIMLGDGELLLSLKVDDSKVDKPYIGIDEDTDTYVDIYQPKVQIGDMVFAQAGGGATIEPGDETSKNMLLTCDLNQLSGSDEPFDLISNLDVNKDYDVKIEIDKIGYTIEGSDKNIPDQTKLPDHIKISEVNGGGINIDTGESFETRQVNILGNWTFETNINVEKLVEDIKIYNINESFTINYQDMNIDVIVKEVRVSPTKVKINYEYEVEGEAKKGDDEPPVFLGFILKDEKDNEIELRGGFDLSYATTNTQCAEGELISEMNEIKIIPIIDDCSKQYNSIKKFEDKAFTLE